MVPRVAFSAALTCTPPMPRKPPSEEASATFSVMLVGQALKAAASPRSVRQGWPKSLADYRENVGPRRLAFHRQAACAGRPRPQLVLPMSRIRQRQRLRDRWRQDQTSLAVETNCWQSLVASPRPSTWICCRDRHASQHRAFQDFGPFFRRKILLVRHDNLLSLQLQSRPLRPAGG